MGIKVAEIPVKVSKAKVNKPKKEKIEKVKLETPILYAVVIWRHEGYSRIMVNRHEDRRELYSVVCKAEKEEKQLLSLHKTYRKKNCSRYIEKDIQFEIPARRVDTLEEDIARAALPLGSRLIGNKDKKKEVLQILFKDLDFKFPNLPYKIIENSTDLTVIALLSDPRIGKGEHLIILDFRLSLYSYSYEGKVKTRTNDIKKIV